MNKTFWQLQRQRTAGAYKTLATFCRKDAAIEVLTNIAAQTPDFPYHGEDTYKDSNNRHHVNRYKIVPVEIKED